MKRDRRSVLLGLLVLIAATAYAWSATAADPGVFVPERERVCMVQDTVMGVPAVPVTHDGKTYFGCCEMCKGRIASEPQRYTLGTDPVSGKVVDKATASLLSVNGRVFYFESEGNRDRFASDPSQFARGEVRGGS
jgi:YHS domain-containing protein